MPSVTSSAIAAVDHREDEGVLLVSFTSGRHYAYGDVPRSVYDAFVAATSKGTFFNEEIRDVYPVVELKRAAGRG